MVFTVVMAFAHGSNDTANAVGPVAAVFNCFNEGVSKEAAVSASSLGGGVDVLGPLCGVIEPFKLEKKLLN